MKLPLRDSLEVDRSLPVTETEVEFCDVWSVPRARAESDGMWNQPLLIQNIKTADRSVYIILGLLWDLNSP